MHEQPVGHLQRRKIEGRVLVPFIAACREKFGDTATQEVIAAFIEKASVADGLKSADHFGRGMTGLRRIVDELWGGPSRDHAMLKGFNDGIELERSQTIMQGGACCDFRFRKKAPSAC